MENDRINYEDFRQTLLDEYGSNFISDVSDMAGRYFITKGVWMSELTDIELDSYLDWGRWSNEMTGTLPPDKLLYYYFDSNEDGLIEVFSVLILNIHQTGLDEDDKKTLFSIYDWVNSWGDDSDLYLIYPKKKIQVLEEVGGDFEFVVNKIGRTSEIETSGQYIRLDSIPWDTLGRKVIRDRE